MSIGVAFPSCRCHYSLFRGKGSSALNGDDWKGKLLNAAKWQQLPVLNGASKAKPLIIKAAHLVNPSTFSSRISIDIPFNEAPEASFDQYLEEKPRVLGSILPERQASRQLNEDEWRIHMLPMQSLFLTVWPVVDMRLKCISNALEYPCGVPHDSSKVLELEIIRLELRGLDEIVKQSQFSIDVKGSLYTDRKGMQSRLKGHTQLSVGFTLPPMLALVADHICRDVAESVLRRFVESLKHTVNSSLIADYIEFKRERLKSLACTMDSSSHVDNCLAEMKSNRHLKKLK